MLPSAARVTDDRATALAAALTRAHSLVWQAHSRVVSSVWGSGGVHCARTVVHPDRCAAGGAVSLYKVQHSLCTPLCAPWAQPLCAPHPARRGRAPSWLEKVYKKVYNPDREYP